MTQLLAPNGKPSNLTPEQYKLVRLPEFKAWFGDWENLILTKLNDSGIDEVSLKRLEDGVSKVVDENGEPKVTYRGNRKSHEDLGYEFVLGHNFLNKENPNKFGFFFTDDVDVAKKYGGSITQVFLNVKNLFDLTELGIITDGNNFIQYLEIKGISFKGFEKLKFDILEYDRTYDKIDVKQWHTPNIYDFFDVFPELKDFFQDRDYNAVVFKEKSRSYFPYLTYAIFESNQIKLADGTNTIFDGNNPDIRFDEGGSVIINPTEIECHKCHWKWKVKDGGDDLFICHKCYTDNSKFYKFEGLKGEKILDTITYEKGGQLLNLNLIRKGQYEAKSDEIEISLSNPKILNGFGTNKWQLVILYGNDSVINEWFDTKNEALKTGAILLNDFLNSNFKKGGRTIAQTPAPKKDQIKGSDKNKEGSSKDLTSAKKIELSDSTIEAIKNKVDKHNEKYPKKKITIDSAKAVVRRGMGAYSSSYRPTISGGKPNNRVAWGLARLNAFLYKIVNGKSKSGKYSQDNDLIEELGYNVEKYEIGGVFQGTPYDFDKYSTEYMGTGEGLQVFGWGLYFTDIKDIAKNYAKNEMLIEKEISRKSDDFGLLVIYTNISNDVVDKLGYLKYKLKEFEDKKKEYKIDIWDDKIEKYSTLIDIIQNYQGKIYSVTLFKGEKETDYHLIKWENPLIVDDLVKIFDEAEKIGGIEFKNGWELDEIYGLTNERGNKITGEEMYRWLSKQLGGDKEASLFLLRAGIDGIKYKSGTLSGMSDKEGYNYVIFDANDITIEGKEKYADGGDIQAYEEAMGITYSEGGETKPKKVYVSIRLDNKIERDFPNYFWKYDEKTFEELKNGVLKGLVGVSSSPNNIAEWFIHRDCLIVMDYKEFIAINETETINYYDPYQLMKNNLYLFKRLYANIGARSSNEEGSYVFKQTLVKILEKIVREINLEMNLAEGQKYSELYRISRFLSPYETSAFPDWIEENKIKIESPIDLTNAIIDFNKMYDGYLGSGFETPVLTFDELLPIVEKGISRASSIYDSEQEIVLINRELNIPKNSQLFFIGKDEVGRIRESNLDELIENYNLKELYKVYFVDRQQIQKYRDFWVKKEEEKFNKKLEQGREDLEFKKEQVLNELLNYFLENSINYVKNELEKEYLEYSESLQYYDETDDDSIEQNLFSIPLVESIMNTYVLIVKNFWKSFIQKKQVKDLNIYAFDIFYFNVKQELKNYFENKKDELDKLNNYRNTRSSGSLDPYRFERLLLKTIDDYEKLPELIDYKELSKMYLDKMGRELYRYYDKKDLPLISQYKDGGETDEPTEFWGTEAGGVLVYCSTTERYLILLRSEWVLEPNTWGIISGKLDDEENVQEAVLREAQEETGYKLGNLIPSFIFEKPNFKFHNFVSIVEEEFTPELDWENSDYRWVKLNEMPENLHFGLKILLQKEDLPKLVKKNKMENEILIIDCNYLYRTTNVLFKNKEIPATLNPPKNQMDFMNWAYNNKFYSEDYGLSGSDDLPYGDIFEVPFINYIDYLKTEKFYTGGELKKGIKTEMEHKNTIKKIKTGDYTLKESAELIAKDHLEENDKYYTHLSKMEKQFGEGGLTAKKEDFNVPTTESLIESVSKEREKYIKNLRKQGFKVVVGRNDGYYWNLESEKDGVSELAKNPSKRKVLEIIKNNPSVTKIGFQGTLLVADKVGEELEIVDDFAVVLWEKDSIFFKEGLNFEFVYDNGKYINVIVNKNDTETYKDRKDDGNYVYFKSIDKKYNTISERRSKIEFLKEEFDNGEAFIVNKMEEGGKVESIHSSKGDIKLSLEENWYSDDTDVELVPVSELIKFREFDRKVSPKYNKENSVDNINHLKFMFQKDGVKSPLIIEYSKEDNAVLIIEGNHRLNSAIDLGMEYLPARVVLKKYSKFSKSQLKNAMKVSGVEGDQYGYVPSNMKPSKVGIQGTKSLVFGDGGIIEGRLHSECGDDGCGRKFQVGENGHIIEAERDEAVIVADAFESNEELTIKGTPSEVASALNVIGGGKNFDKGATIIKNGSELEIPELKKQAIDTDVDDVIDPSSIIINRRSMADEKEYEVTGTPKQIASAINSINGNGVVIENGAEIKEN